MNRRWLSQTLDRGQRGIGIHLATGINLVFEAWQLVCRRTNHFTNLVSLERPVLREQKRSQPSHESRGLAGTRHIRVLPTGNRAQDVLARSGNVNTSLAPV